MAAQKLKTLEEMTGLSFGGAKKKSDLNDILKQNAKSRVRIAEVGEDDPTKKRGPSALERIFGPLDVLGTGVRGLVHNAVDDKEDVDVWQEMAKSLKGEERVEGADILGDLGVENKWGKMLGGFAVDVLTDPLTYLTLGFGSAAKAGGKAAFNAVSKYGDDAARVAAELGKSAQEADKIIDVFRSANVLDDAGRFLPDALAKLGKGGSQDLMTALYKQFGKGGVKFAGIGLGGENAASKLGYGAKGVGRAIDRSGLIEKTFGHGNIDPELIDIMRGGNEAVSTLIKNAYRTANGKKRLATVLGERFADTIKDALPDERTRMFLTKAYSESFIDELPEIVRGYASIDKAKNALTLAIKNRDAAKEAIARADIQKAWLSVTDAATRGYDNVGQRLAADMLAVGIDDDTAARAVGVVDMFKQKFDDVAQRIEAAGGDVSRLMGEDSAFFIPGSAPIGRDTAKAMKPLDEFVQEAFGVSVKQMDEAKPYKLGSSSALSPLGESRKKYLEPVSRQTGRTRASLGVDAAGNLALDPEKMTAGIATEFDFARLGGKGVERGERNAALAQLQDDLVKALGDAPESREIVGRLASAKNGFFTSDEATQGWLRIYDKVNNWWKRQATVLRMPAFSNRNGITNKIQMYQDGALSAAGEIKSFGVIRDLQLLKSGKLPQSKVQEIENLLDELVEHGVLTSFEEISEQIGTKARGWLTTRVGAAINNVVENQSRVSAYFTYLNKGIDKRAAGEMTSKALLDYSDEALSIVESNIIRRLVPFYKWTKGNLSKQARVLFESPGRSVWLGHLKQSGEAVTDYDKSVMPTWFRDMFPIPTPATDKSGNPVMLSTAGLFPQGDLELLSGILGGKFDPKDAFGMISPLLRTPLELIYNRDLWYDSDIEKYPGEKKRVPSSIEIASDAILPVPGVGEVWKFVLDRVGIESREEDGEQYLAASAKSLKVLRDFMPWLNNINKMLADQPRTPYDRVMGLTGVKPVLFEQERFAKNQAYEDRASLNDVIQRLKDEGRIPEQQPKASLADLFGGGR